ncbi:hypothetical protein HK100_007646 [Physocladia obscura]|uniref:Uncharacterized protein n=1 Tax=Physocladia obscura TaxID=109957 RepID=A0AAD5SQ62_9FUNG|nr:hypothetical protein HK100_007646 [Physocladia obscura]
MTTQVGPDTRVTVEVEVEAETATCPVTGARGARPHGRVQDINFHQKQMAVMQNRRAGFSKFVYDFNTLFWVGFARLFALLGVTTGQWLKLPVVLALPYMAVRNQALLHRNTRPPPEIPEREPQPQPQPQPRGADANSAGARPFGGFGNDPADALVGGAGEPFGRNTHLVTDTRVASPPPDLVARTLLTRTPDSFVPATPVNLFVAAWIQFLLHDLFDHNLDLAATETVGSQTVNPSLQIPGTDHVYGNRVDHFLNGSQLYGDTVGEASAIVDFETGKMRLKDGYLPVDEQTNIETLGFKKNIWFGLALIHYIFALEHNTIVDKFKELHPDWTGVQLFNQARLIISALIAKIQGIEWTPSIIQNPTGVFGQKHMFYGFLGQKFRRKFGTQRWLPNYINGILGGKLNYRGAKYANTEEFVSIYRMHSLVPEAFTVYDATNNNKIADYKVFEGVFEGSHKINTSSTKDNLIYSMGVNNPGALVLNNYPTVLRNVRDQSDDSKLGKIDLACIDIIRDRERGVPRYNEFRRGFLLKPIKKWKDLTQDSAVIAKLQSVYGENYEDLDLLIGTLAEDKLPNFVFGETTYSVFMAQTQRRIECDRFLTIDYNEQVYTKEGIDWVEYTTFATILRRHFPAVRDLIKDDDNAFLPWKKATAAREP